ncbi:MAG: DUF2335 domain-containing protein [Chloroflexi bacterium]|nr:DUF2335 domain-containing protein [Chloroflexota bacterium]
MTDLQNADDKLSQAPGVSSRSPFPTELLHFVPTEKRAEFLRAIAAYRLEVERVEQYSGPIPHPFVVERYEATLAGSTDRILKMAEERQTANIELERLDRQTRSEADLAAVRGLVWNHRQAMLLFVGLALVIVIAGTRIIELGHGAEGFAMIAGTACGVIVAYIKSYSSGGRYDTRFSEDE